MYWLRTVAIKNFLEHCLLVSRLWKRNGIKYKLISGVWMSKGDLFVNAETIVEFSCQKKIGNDLREDLLSENFLVLHERF